MKKRILSVVLVLMMLICTITVNAEESGIVIIENNESLFGTGYVFEEAYIDCNNYTDYLSLTTYEEKCFYFYDVFFKNWNDMNPKEHLDNQKLYLNFLCEELNVENIPDLDIYATNYGFGGYYSYGDNTIHINQFYSYDGVKMFEAISHEMRHAWQRSEIEKDTELGKIFYNSFVNYIDYTAGEDYKTLNIVESDAFAFQNLKLEQYNNIGLVN